MVELINFYDFDSFQRSIESDVYVRKKEANEGNGSNEMELR